MRRTLLVPVAAVALSLGLAAPAQAAPVVTKDPAQSAAGWLARQLVDGERFESEWEGTVYHNQGLVVDTILALDAAGVGQDYAVKAMNWLAKPDIAVEYLGDGTTTVNTGGHAKYILAASAQGQNPTTFAGIDHVTRLLGQLQTNGRFTDKRPGGADYSSPFTQALDVIALERTSAKAPTKAVDYLAKQQCADGGFGSAFDAQQCTSSVDTTGLAAVAMLAAGRNAEAGKALDYLAKQQQSNGGFNNGLGPVSNDKPINANSTANALQALRAGARKAPGDKAHAYLLGIQAGCAAPAQRQGAILHTATGDAALATAPSIIALTGVSLSTVSNKGAAPAAPTLDCTTPATSAPATAGPQLPVTGSPNGLIAATGAVMLALGVFVVALARRRRTQ